MDKTNESGIFRCVMEKPDTVIKLREPKPTMRPPGNVPYVVDNLWEWKRPHNYPSRRYSVFASPRPELAKNSGPEGGRVYTVEFNGRHKLCQVKGYSDSKFHHECKSLKKLILHMLGHEWVEGNLAKKEEIGRLWMPCLTKDEINFLFESNKKLRKIREEVYNSISYWDNVAIITVNTTFPNEKGELFFEATDGYYLRKTEVC